jgi:hypothetical protein
MTNIDKIKDKIRKLFALSKSPNASEAALALEMAQKLMVEHSIRRNEVGEFEVSGAEVKGNGGTKPPRYEAYLISEIAGAFGCKTAYGKIKLKPRQFFGYDFDFGYNFAGLEHRVKMASFIAEVLLRKLKKARSEYMKKLNRVRLRSNKIKRGDDFCIGWVVTVVSKLHKFANTAEEQLAIDNYVEGLNWDGGLKLINRKAVKKAGVNDFVNGRKAAADVQIQHGVEGQESGARLLEATE